MHARMRPPDARPDAHRDMTSALWKMPLGIPARDARRLPDRMTMTWPGDVRIRVGVQGGGAEADLNNGDPPALMLWGEE